MKMLKKEYYSINQLSLWSIGVAAFAVYAFILFWSPMEAWCDDVFFADMGFQIFKGSNNSHVWSSGFISPSYYSLYSLFYWGWYNIFGFSFFTAHFPNILLSLVCFIVFGYALTFELNEKANKVLIILYGVLYWTAPIWFWTINCGRKEVWSLFFMLLSIIFFYRAYTDDRRRDLIFFLICSIFTFDASLQAAIGTTLFIGIYGLFDIKVSFKKWLLYFANIAGYIIAFGGQAALAISNHHLKRFLMDYIGNSATIMGLYNKAVALLTGKSVIVGSSTSSLAEAQNTGILERLGVSYLLNVEYLVLAVIIICLVVLLYRNGAWRKSSVLERSFVIFALSVPFVFTILGRYPIYYTWIAYIGAVAAIIMLSSKLSNRLQMVGLICSFGMLVWLNFSERSAWYMRVDFDRSIDKQNLKEIEDCQIDFNKPTVVPYVWYYYLADQFDNLYTQAGAQFPENLDKIIINPYDYNEDSFMEQYEMEYERNVGNKQIYRVIRRKW